jgi:hypothetical protein
VRNHPIAGHFCRKSDQSNRPLLLVSSTYFCHRCYSVTNVRTPPGRCFRSAEEVDGKAGSGESKPNVWGNADERLLKAVRAHVRWSLAENPLARATLTPSCGNWTGVKAVSATKGRCSRKLENNRVLGVKPISNPTVRHTSLIGEHSSARAALVLTTPATLLGE